jgi:hypothetical protein
MIEEFPLQNLEDFERLETILHDGRCRKRLVSLILCLLQIENCLCKYQIFLKM